MLCSSSIKERYSDSLKIENLLNSVKEDIFILDSNEVMLLTSSLLKDLNENTDNHEWDNQTTTQIITMIKYLGKRVDGSDILYKYQGVSILLNLAGLTIKENETLKDTSASQESLKCIANGLLLRSEIKQWLKTENISQNFVRLLDDDNISTETQFLVCRILYLITLEEDALDFIKQIIDINLNKSLAKILNKHVYDCIDNETMWETKSNTEQPKALIIEALKLLLNLLETLEDSMTSTSSVSSVSVKSSSSSIPSVPDNEIVSDIFKDCLPAIYNIIFILPFAKPIPLVAPFMDALRCLTHYTFNVALPVWNQTESIMVHCPTQDASLLFYCNAFIKVLSQTFLYLFPTTQSSSSLSSLSSSSTNGRKPRLSWQKYAKPSNYDVNIDKELTVMIQVFYHSMLLHTTVKNCINQLMIPSNHPINENNDNNNDEKIEKDKSIFEFFIRFVKLTTITNLPLSKECASEFLYFCVDEDPQRLIQLIGYQYAYPILVERDVDDDKLNELKPNDDEDDNDFMKTFYVGINQLLDRMTEENERDVENLWLIFNQTKLNPS